MMKHIALITFLLCCTSISKLKAQLINTGQLIHIEKDGLMMVNGDYKHIDGTISGAGILELKGDWNNLSSSAVFLNSVTKVTFSGSDQYIKGSKTVFPTINLAGSGIKSLETDADVSGLLLLNDKQLNTKNFSLAVLNTDVKAIDRTSGFVSTDGGGMLVRNTNRNAVYLFPLGSSKNNPAFSGINQSDINPLYRPVAIEPESSGFNLYAVSFQNHDPDAEYNRSKKQVEVTDVSDKYFYLLHHTSGASKFATHFYQNSGIENSQIALAWNKTASMWEKLSTSVTEGVFGDRLDKKLSFIADAGINFMPVTFANSATTRNPFTFFNAFSPDGDGRNDRWLINNIELYPDNKLSIYNRWGDEVFKTAGYNNANAWDGNNLQSGTYFYVLNVNINGSKQTFKGFITMIKKD